MTVQESLMYSTLRLSYTSQTGEHFFASSFLLRRRVRGNQARIYLISNRHVFFHAQQMQITFTALGRNGQPDFGNLITIPLDNIAGNAIGHPNPRVDIAALDFTSVFLDFQNRLFCMLSDYEMLATFTEPQLSVAQNVYFIGYPANRYDQVNNLPLVRQGLIASHPRFNYNGDPVFIIDAQVFPGSSGSPVFIDLTYEDMKNGHYNVGGRRIVKLLGIVAMTMVRNNRLQASNLFAEEVLGLGIVFKSTAIRELLDSMSFPR